MRLVYLLQAVHCQHWQCVAQPFSNAVHTRRPGGCCSLMVGNTMGVLHVGLFAVVGTSGCECRALSMARWDLK